MSRMSGDKIQPIGCQAPIDTSIETRRRASVSQQVEAATEGVGADSETAGSFQVTSAKSRDLSSLRFAELTIK